MGLVLKLVRWALAGVLVLVLGAVAVRTVEAKRAPPLHKWHTHVPMDATAREINAMTWGSWMAREDAVMEEVRRTITNALPDADRIPQNRYWAGSPVHAPSLPKNWNRSFVMMPDGPLSGAVVLLHGLTDAPYSLRHVGERYRARGFLVVAPRMPGHGTVPAGLTRAQAADWQAATMLAVREARRRAGGDVPLHIVGYSNGGALALRHALAALEDPALGVPDQLVLISPMIGLTPFARFSGLAGWPAFLPSLARAAWLDVIPEFNPFKYNSFPVTAAVESHRLTRLLDKDLAEARRTGAIDRLPPVLAFQSVVDSTVSSQAVVTGLFDRLSTGEHELVLFDVNRAAKVVPLMRVSALEAADRLLNPGSPSSGPRPYRVSVVVNVSPDDPAVMLRSVPAGGGAEVQAPIEAAFPPQFHSLGHVALPFPLSDGLYGFLPDPEDHQGYELGRFFPHGENGTLAVSANFLSRVSSNPFFDWMADHIMARLPAAGGMEMVAAPQP